MKIAIIGAGNMGGAIAHGLLKAKAVEPQQLFVADLNSEILKSFTDLGVQTFAHNADAAKGVDIVIIAVKPWLAQEVMHKLHAVISPQTMVVSIAAGITLEQMQNELGGRPVFRVIPNTAAAVGQSMTFVSSDNTTQEQEQNMLKLFSAIGKTMLIPEKLMSAATALSSCGIAFAMRYVSANMRAGVELGFTPNVAEEIILQTMQGAIALLEQTGQHPEVEIDKVTTPNGLTIKGLNRLDHEGFSSAVINAVKAAI